MALEPLGDRVIVAALGAEEITASGIVLPDTAKEKPQRGKVVAVGPGRYVDGQRQPLVAEPRRPAAAGQRFLNVEEGGALVAPFGGHGPL